MTEFWEANFSEKQEMWGLTPAHSAIMTKDLFAAKRIKHVLIPGIGYGRNAQVFRDAGMTVTGIEISQTAIAMARKHHGMDMTIHHGSVTDMPFDEQQYDGIFCYALIHLLDGNERAKLIRDCYHQLTDGGYMVFTLLSKNAPTYRQGKYISEDRYEVHEGVHLFFYDRASVHTAFDAFGVLDITEVEENLPLFMVTCRKPIPSKK